jgi:hypothetical protein
MNPTDGAQTIAVTDARYGTATTRMPPHSIQTWQW